jgi:hypothetical protein
LNHQERAFISRLLKAGQDRLLHEFKPAAARAFRETLHCQIHQAQSLLSRIPETEE